MDPCGLDLTTQTDWQKEVYLLVNSIYTAEQVKDFEKNSFVKKGDGLLAMMEAARQSVEILNKTYSSSDFLILCGLVIMVGMDIS